MSGNAVVQAVDTLRMQVFGADGRVKPIWQENRAGTWLMRLGVLPAAWHIPGLGQWQDYKEVSVWR